MGSPSRQGEGKREKGHKGETPRQGPGGALLCFSHFGAVSWGAKQRGPCGIVRAKALPGKGVRMRFFVVGDVSVDLLFFVERIPEPGEELPARSAHETRGSGRHPGGPAGEPRPPGLFGGPGGPGPLRRAGLKPGAGSGGGPPPPPGGPGAHHELRPHPGGPRGGAGHGERRGGEPPPGPLSLQAPLPGPGGGRGPLRLRLGGGALPELCGGGPRGRQKTGDAHLRRSGHGSGAGGGGGALEVP